MNNNLSIKYDYDNHVIHVIFKDIDAIIPESDFATMSITNLRTGEKMTNLIRKWIKKNEKLLQRKADE